MTYRRYDLVFFAIEAHTTLTCNTSVSMVSSSPRRERNSFNSMTSSIKRLRVLEQERMVSNDSTLLDRTVGRGNQYNNYDVLMVDLCDLVQRMSVPQHCPLLPEYLMHPTVLHDPSQSQLYSLRLQGLPSLSPLCPPCAEKYSAQHSPLKAVEIPISDIIYTSTNSHYLRCYSMFPLIHCHIPLLHYIAQHRQKLWYLYRPRVTITH